MSAKIGNPQLEYKKRIIRHFFEWKQREQVPDWFIDERISFSVYSIQKHPDCATDGQIRTLRALMETSRITLELIRQGKIVRSGPTKEDRKYCQKCVFWKSASGENTYACHYILDIGHRRGCKPGVGCTKRTTRRFRG